MSAQEERNEIIREYLPKLIKSLTGFKNDDENLRHCEHFAWSTIRNHRNLSTNSHEVRRKIEGMQEKFRVENCGEYATHLGRLCDEIIEHPLCVEHYEVDVQWSLLDLLLELAYNPAAALRRRKHEIDLKQCAITKDENVERERKEADYWRDALKEDFIPTEQYHESDSDLSNWSDDSEETHSNPASNDDTKQKNKTEKAALSSVTKSDGLKPPEKAQPYIRYDGAGAEQRLRKTVQHTWWQHDLPQLQPEVESKRMAANFAHIYNRFLSESSNNLIRYKEPITTSEHCLMRELIWMFHEPQTCKFFEVTGEHIRVRDNISIPSLTVGGLHNYLEEHFLPYVRMMHTIRKFLRSIYASDDFTPPKTMECYADSLRLLLKPIWQELLDYEQALLEQKDFAIMTLISMQRRLKGTFEQLVCIYKVHTQSVLNLQQFPAHISSAYLLASFMHCYSLASKATESNLPMALFLASVKIFCVIIDTWWTEGRLDDWQQEFVIERVSSDDHNVCMREYKKNREKAFFVPTHVSKIIAENSFLQLLVEHSLEAGCTLNLLYEINRIGDLRSNCDAIEGKLYNVFIDDVLQHVRQLQTESIPIALKALPSNTSEIVDGNDSENVAEDIVDTASAKATSSTQIVLNNLTTNDEFLLLAFASNIQLEKDEVDANVSASAATLAGTKLQQSEPDALSLFEEFKQYRHILPLEEIILGAMSNILRTRIAFANSFVMRLYRDEFVILKHLGNIRKVLLLEASDVMHQFYDKLFILIESGAPWANPFLLTMQLDDTLCSKHPEMSSIFRVEINSTFRCETQKVYEAVDELIITYNFNRELAHIITQQDITEYNKVFRFLLKVKWGLLTLEKLRFPRAHKRKVPYAPYELTDLLMRRLEQLRFWMLYALQSIHFHLMTHVLQSMGEQLEKKISKCTNLKEMERVHKSYISTVCEHCFLGDSFSAIKLGVEQLLNLIFILRMEWNSCASNVDANYPLSIDANDSSDEWGNVNNSQIGAIEETYIRCHQYLANKLNNEVYLKHKSFLLGLCAVFNTSLPY